MRRRFLDLSRHGYRKQHHNAHRYRSDRQSLARSEQFFNEHCIQHQSHHDSAFAYRRWPDQRHRCIGNRRRQRGGVGHQRRDVHRQQRVLFFYRQHRVPHQCLRAGVARPHDYRQCRRTTRAGIYHPGNKPRERTGRPDGRGVQLYRGRLIQQHCADLCVQYGRVANRA